MSRPQYFICEDLFSDLATYLNMIHYFSQSLNGLLDMHNTEGTPCPKTILSNVWYHSYKCVLSYASCHNNVTQYTYSLIQLLQGPPNLTASPWIVTEKCWIPILAALYMQMSSNISSLNKSFYTTFLKFHSRIMFCYAIHTPMSYGTPGVTIWLWSKDYLNPCSLKQPTAKWPISKFTCQVFLSSGHLFN
jgi:hypothetical protein